ncbi:MAG: Rieske 2Fe-2S domain-containing protein [Rhodospirillales bacterium]|nr:Rieske 2Fe-2S domain-containing protein [Rhodospirillales bacterium]
MPALFCDQLPEPDCPPVRVKLLGENLVAFRDSEGRVGLLDERCPHRTASLYFGRNEECGLRCVYHGWKFDVNGNCVDLPSEPPGNNLAAKIKIKSYPCAEQGGVVWTFMGDAQESRHFRNWNGRGSRRHTGFPPVIFSNAIGCRGLRAVSIPRIFPSCIQVRPT